MNKTTFWNLIGSTNIKKICIPTIQRDFALGRHGRAFNRYSFLNALKTAICGEEELSLDFVYGVDNGTMFVPLDGQQRLTTLWLLHWFIAYKAEIIKEQGISFLMKLVFPQLIFVSLYVTCHPIKLMNLCENG